MNRIIEDAISYIRTDVDAIKRIVCDATMNEEDKELYLHAIDVLADHITDQTLKMETIESD